MRKEFSFISFLLFLQAEGALENYLKALQQPVHNEPGLPEVPEGSNGIDLMSTVIETDKLPLSLKVDMYIRGGFDWKDTPQGKEYWAKLAERWMRHVADKALEVAKKRLEAKLGAAAEEEESDPVEED